MEVIRRLGVVDDSNRRKPGNATIEGKLLGELDLFRAWCAKVSEV